MCLQIDVVIDSLLRDNRMHHRARLLQNPRYSVKRDAKGEDRQDQRDDYWGEMPVLKSKVAVELAPADPTLEQLNRILALLA